MNVSLMTHTDKSSKIQNSWVEHKTGIPYRQGINRVPCQKEGGQIVKVKVEQEKVEQDSNSHREYMESDGV